MTACRHLNTRSDNPYPISYISISHLLIGTYLEGFKTSDHNSNKDMHSVMWSEDAEARMVRTGLTGVTRSPCMYLREIMTSGCMCTHLSFIGLQCRQ